MIQGTTGRCGCEMGKAATIKRECWFEKGVLTQSWGGASLMLHGASPEVQKVGLPLYVGDLGASI